MWHAVDEEMSNNEEKRKAKNVRASNELPVTTFQNYVSNIGFAWSFQELQSGTTKTDTKKKKRTQTC